MPRERLAVDRPAERRDVDHEGLADEYVERKLLGGSGSLDEVQGRIDMVARRGNPSSRHETSHPCASAATTTLAAHVRLRGFGVFPREQHGGEDSSLAAWLRRVGDAGLEDAHEVVEKLHELGVVEPHPRDAEVGAVAHRVDVSSCEVALEVADQAGDEREKGLPQLLGCHLGDLVQAEACCRRPQHVGALDRPADAPLAYDDEDAAVDELGNVAVEAAGRYVGKLAPKLARRERAVAEEGPHDPHSDRVEEELKAGHESGA